MVDTGVQMTDLNGRTISVGDKAPGGTITDLTTLNGQPAIQVQFDILNQPGGYTQVAALTVTCAPGYIGTSGWWTCFPQMCRE